MSPEEKPTSDSEPESQSNLSENGFDKANSPSGNSEMAPVQASFANDEPIVPEIVESEIMEAEISGSTSIAYPYGSPAATTGPGEKSLISIPGIPRNFENLAAKGGAVGALVLGIWCFAGSFVTNWSIINGLLGLLMGFWGLTSQHKKMAWIGILLCLAGVLLSLVQVSEIVNTYLNARDENTF